MYELEITGKYPLPFPCPIFGALPIDPPHAHITFVNYIIETNNLKINWIFITLEQLIFPRDRKVEGNINADLIRRGKYPMYFLVMALYDGIKKVKIGMERQQAWLNS